MIFQEEWFMLGSNCLVTLNMEDELKAKKVLQSLRRKIVKFEKKFSRFLPESEVVRFNLNQNSSRKVSYEFLEILKLCLKMSKKTDHIFNPFILPALQKAAYVGSWPNVGDFVSQTNFSTKNVCQVKDIKIKQNLVYLPPNCAIDLGGIGKGYLLDNLGDDLRTSGVDNFWLSFGGDILVSGSDTNRTGWQISIQKAQEPLDQIDLIETEGRTLGIATSGITKRQGSCWHHLIDPHTLKPAMTDVLTATVVAKNALEADVLAKTLVILGSKKAEIFIETQKLSQYVLQLKNGEILRIRS